MSDGLVVTIFGEPWTWKSHLAISAVDSVQGNLAIIDLDQRLAGVLPKFAKQSKRIKLERPELPQAMGMDDMAKVVSPHGAWLAAFKKVGGLFRRACEDPTIEVIDLDTSTIYYQIVREARLDQIALEAKGEGKVRAALTKYEYGPCNSYMLGSYNYARSKGKTLILVAHSRPVYDAEGNETDEQEADSWSGQIAASDIIVQTVRIGDDVRLIVKKNGYSSSVTSSALPCTWATITELSQGKHTAKVAK